VADDKKKEENEEGKKKKGLPAIVMIAIGAVVGGAGVVFAVPPKTVVEQAPAPVFEDVFITHPDVIEIEFNPRQRTGKAVARMSFKFVYKVHQDVKKTDKQDAAIKLIGQNWDSATATSLELLRSRTVKELGSEMGSKILKHDLIERLNNSFFPGEHPVAQVSDVLVLGLLMQ